MNETDVFKTHLSSFETYAKKKLANKKPPNKILDKAICYSFFSGGKRLRPLLVLEIAKALSINPKKVLSWALSLEMIHAGSLILDDLPCMDNASTRRGKASTHKKFGQDIACLAASSLFIQAFEEICQKEAWVKALAKGTGKEGLMQGQALDLKYKKNQNLNQILALKTGRLFELCGFAPLSLKKVSPKKSLAIKNFLKSFGKAFQIADDFLDKNEKSKSNLVNSVGQKKGREHLKRETQKSLNALKAFDKKAGFLKFLTLYNLQRAEKQI